MDIGRRTLLAAGLIGSFASVAAQAQDWGNPRAAASDPEMPQWPPRERIRLWPKEPPGAGRQRPAPSWMMYGDKGRKQLWIKGVAQPELNVFRAAKPDGSALLCFPGGSYEFLAVQNEGSEPARFFNAQGTTVFVLAYRLPGEGWDNRHFVPLQDAQRAMRLIRAQADAFGIDAKRLGVLGFSAGGHLAADLATSFARTVYDPVDDADAQSAGPAFAGLVYPVATLNPAITHGGSLNNLLGPNPSDALRAERSPERNVGGETPPCFLIHPIDDDLVPVENSIEFMAACRRAKVPVESHFFASGGHGFGTRLPSDMPGSRWPELFALWMRKHGG